MQPHSFAAPRSLYEDESVLNNGFFFTFGFSKACGAGDAVA